MMSDSSSTDFKTDETPTKQPDGGFTKYAIAGAVVNTFGSIAISWGFIGIALLVTQFLSSPDPERVMIPDSPALLFFKTPEFLCAISPFTGAILGACVRYYQNSKTSQVIATALMSAIQLLIPFGLVASINGDMNTSLILALAFFAFTPLPGIIGCILVPLIVPKWVPYIR